MTAPITELRLLGYALGAVTAFGLVMAAILARASARREKAETEAFEQWKAERRLEEAVALSIAHDIMRQANAAKYPKPANQAARIKPVKRVVTMPLIGSDYTSFRTRLKCAQWRLKS